jgi:chromosome segregation ATPase
MTKCGDSPVAGAPEKITSLRNRFDQVAESVAIYEAKVANQTSQLSLMNNILSQGQDYDEENEEVTGAVEARREVAPVTEDELRAEEQEIKELEQKKRALEERVASMEKDLGGLLR